MPTHPQYYVTLSPPPNKQTREPEANFELWDSNNYLTPITTSASANLPVCAVQLPEHIAPSNNFDIGGRPALCIISSNGSVTLDLDSTDTNSPEDYFMIIAISMAACLHISSKCDSQMSCTFPRTLRGSDHPPPELHPDDAHGRTKINLGKMFVDSCVKYAGAHSDDPACTAVVDWPIPTVLNGREKKTKPVAVLTYIVTARTAWSVLSAALPKTRFMVPREPVAENLSRFVILKF